MRRIWKWNFHNILPFAGVWKWMYPHAFFIFMTSALILHLIWEMRLKCRNGPPSHCILHSTHSVCILRTSYTVQTHYSITHVVSVHIHTIPQLILRGMRTKKTRENNEKKTKNKKSRSSKLRIVFAVWSKNMWASNQPENIVKFGFSIFRDDLLWESSKTSCN